MIGLSTALRSSVGKKYLMALSGLVWFGFVIGHLTGNLLLLVGREAFNEYAEFLEHVGHGKLIYLAEAFLLVTLAAHVYNGFTVAISDKNRARPRGYEVNGNARGASQKTLASQTMVWSGLLLLVFLVVHIATFKYGVLQSTEGIAPGDLYARVVRAFSNPLYVGVYVLVMTILGTHLSHGIWSAFQSLGLNNRRIMGFLRPFAYVMAVLLALGFLFLPVSMFVMQANFSSQHGGLLG